MAAGVLRPYLGIVALQRYGESHYFCFYHRDLSSTQGDRVLSGIE